MNERTDDEALEAAFRWITRLREVLVALDTEFGQPWPIGSNPRSLDTGLHFQTTGHLLSAIADLKQYVENALRAQLQPEP